MKEDQILLHKRAFELYSKGKTLIEIARELGKGVDTIKRWKYGDIACTCGYHDWDALLQHVELKVGDIVEKTAAELVERELKPALDRIRSELVPKLCETISIAIEATQDSLRDGSLVPRSWKDLEILLRIVEKLTEVTRSVEGQQFTFKEERRRVVELPVDKLDSLADKLLQARRRN